LKDDYFTYWNQWENGFIDPLSDLRHWAEYCDVQPDDFVLEVGIGGGESYIETRHGFCGDLNDNATTYQKRKHPLIRIAQFDGRHLPFPADTFDKVLIRYLIHNLPTDNDRAMLFCEVHRVLKNGGIMVLGKVPRKSYLHLSKYRNLTTINNWILCKKQYFTPQNIRKLNKQLKDIGFDFLHKRKMPGNKFYRDLRYEKNGNQPV